MAERPQGGRGGAVENRFPNVKGPQRPADSKKGASNEGTKSGQAPDKTGGGSK